MNWYPIKLTAHIRTYAFGERLIPERLGKANLPEGVVAETWEISDYSATTGTVTNGALAGRTLHDLVVEYPEELVGATWQGPHFPLLEKFLDASHMLPVHLHADDETARRVYSQPNGKSEAWHILWAAEGASILAGVKQGLSRDELFRLFKAQDYDAALHRFPISAGDTVYVPGGILHAFGPDTLIFEVQQTSDLAQTVMPVDNYGNRHSEAQWDANINATLDELRTHYQPHPNPGLALTKGANRYLIGCAGPHFALERWTLSEAHTEPAHPRRCLTLSNAGETPIRIEYGGGEASQVGVQAGSGGGARAHHGGEETLTRGESCILPAALGEVRIVPEGTASLIACYVPDPQRDIVERLRAAGYGDEAIRALGEVGI